MKRGRSAGRSRTGLLNTDANNIAPRVGAAWRISPGTILRGGYGISFNAGSYANMARQLAIQPPFSTSNTVLAPRVDPIELNNAFFAPVTDVANTYGADKNYDLGRVQTWNADFSRDLNQNWNAGASYTRTTGASLDVVRAPNRGPDGLRIEGVQPFIWQTSEGSSVLNAGDVPAAAPHGERHRRLDQLHAGKVARRCVEHRRRRDRRGAGRSEPRGRMGALEFRSTSPAIERPDVRAAVRSEQALAGQRRHAGRDLRALARVGELHLAVRNAADAARAGGGQRRRARHQRHAARGLSRRADPDLGAEHRSLLQYRGLRRAAAGHVRQREPQHDHRARQPAAERAVVARLAASAQPRHHRSS